MLYRIRALKWTTASSDSYAEAKTLIGWLYVEIWPDRKRWTCPANSARGDCDSIEDGKAKAEAYYRERLLAALEPVPNVVVVGEPVIRPVVPIDEEGT